MVALLPLTERSLVSFVGQVSDLKQFMRLETLGGLPGFSVVVPFLQRHGIRRVLLMVLFDFVFPDGGVDEGPFAGGNGKCVDRFWHFVSPFGKNDRCKHRADAFDTSGQESKKIRKILPADLDPLRQDGVLQELIETNARSYVLPKGRLA